MKLKLSLALVALLGVFIISQSVLAQDTNSSGENNAQDCPAVCIPIWQLHENTCTFNECGSGCGPNNASSFSTQEACMTRLPNATQTCTDSDALDYYVRGSVIIHTDSFASNSGSTDSITDYCISATELREMTCDGSASSSVTYTCSAGCEEGACKNNEAVCGNGVCELYEADDPGGCGPNADSGCLGPPARAGICPQDCPAMIYVTSSSGLRGVVGTDFLAQFYARGGLEPYSWSMEGSLPPGLELSRPGIVCITAPCPQQTYYVYVKGVPMEAGEYKFRLTANDANGNAGGETFVIYIVMDNQAHTVNFNEKFEIRTGQTALLAGSDVRVTLNAIADTCTVYEPEVAETTSAAAATTGAVVEYTAATKNIEHVTPVDEFACPPVAMPMCIEDTELTKTRDGRGCISYSCVRPQACTKEFRTCSDGTSVGRTGSNCEFSACPSCNVAGITVAAANGVETKRMREGQQEIFGPVKVHVLGIYDGYAVLLLTKNYNPARAKIMTEKLRYTMNEEVKITVYSAAVLENPYASVHRPDGTDERVALDQSAGAVATGQMILEATRTDAAIITKMEMPGIARTNYFMYTGIYTNTDLVGDYKVRVDAASEPAKFIVIDTEVLGKYLITGPIGAYRFVTADVSRLNFNDVHATAYAAVYQSSESSAAALVAEFNGRGDIGKIIGIMREKSVESESDIDGNKVIVLNNDKASVILWTHGNLMIQVASGRAPFVPGANSPSVLTGMAVGADNDLVATEILSAYLKKYGSDLGAEVREKTVRPDELIDVAFRLENLKLKFDMLQRNALRLSEYYNSVGDTEAADKFQGVSDMFGKAESMIEDMKAKARDNIDNPGIVADLRTDFKTLKDYVRSILLRMLGADGDDTDG